MLSRVKYPSASYGATHRNVTTAVSDNVLSYVLVESPVPGRSRGNLSGSQTARIAQAA